MTTTTKIITTSHHNTTMASGNRMPTTHMACNNRLYAYMVLCYSGWLEWFQVTALQFTIFHVNTKSTCSRIACCLRWVELRELALRHPRPLMLRIPKTRKSLSMHAFVSLELAWLRTMLAQLPSPSRPIASKLSSTLCHCANQTSCHFATSQLGNH